MGTMSFNTINQSFRQVMGNGIIYNVPKFQRDYSWSEEQWEDLWLDMLELLNDNEDAHYMGYLVLQSSDNKTFDIIDGQQRLATLSVIILTALKLFDKFAKAGIEPEDNKTRAKQYRNSLIGFLDPVTLIPKSKLTLNRNNDDFYQTYLVPLRDLPKRGLRHSEKLLSKCYTWYYAKLKKHLNSSKTGKKLAEYIEIIIDKLFFTVITVSDELNAFKVFETLNARGVRLSSTDLLKNYLFSVIVKEKTHETEINELEKIWEKIIGKLSSETFPNFLRYFWNSYNKLTRKSELFKTIKKTINNKRSVFELIHKLDDYADIYAALNNPDDEFWENEEIKKYVKNLKLFSVKQPISMLMTAHKKLNEEDFIKLLRACSIISFRYNIIGGLNPNEQESVYNEAALKIYNTNNIVLSDIFSLLKRIYPTDETFVAAFKNKEFRTSNARNKNIVKYILFQIEKQISEKDYDLNSPKYSIEHILPENPDEENRPNFEDKNEDIFIYRLGNLTLLEKNINKDIGNLSFVDKKKSYKNSIFDITKSIPEYYENWGMGSIVGRQEWLAKKSKAIWKISNIN